MSGTALGLMLWVLIFYPAWSPRCRRIRKRGKIPTGKGKAWEQDELMPELFDNLDESEL